MIFRLFTILKFLKLFIRRTARKILIPRKTEKYGTAANTETRTIIRSNVFHQPAPGGSDAVKNSFPNAIAFRISSTMKIARQASSITSRMKRVLLEMFGEVSIPRQTEFTITTKIMKYSKKLSALPST